MGSSQDDMMSTELMVERGIVSSAVLGGSPPAEQPRFPSMESSSALDLPSFTPSRRSKSTPVSRSSSVKSPTPTSTPTAPATASTDAVSVKLLDFIDKAAMLQQATIDASNLSDHEKNVKIFSNYLERLMLQIPEDLFQVWSNEALTRIQRYLSVNVQQRPEQRQAPESDSQSQDPQYLQHLINLFNAQQTQLAQQKADQEAKAKSVPSDPGDDGSSSASTFVINPVVGNPGSSVNIISTTSAPSLKLRTTTTTPVDKESPNYVPDSQLTQGTLFGDEETEIEDEDEEDDSTQDAQKRDI